MLQPLLLRREFISTAGDGPPTTILDLIGPAILRLRSAIIVRTHARISERVDTRFGGVVPARTAGLCRMGSASRIAGTRRPALERLLAERRVDEEFGRTKSTKFW
jgi:hypothetical protein